MARVTGLPGVGPGAGVPGCTVAHRRRMVRRRRAAQPRRIAHAAEQLPWQLTQCLSQPLDRLGDRLHHLADLAQHLSELWTAAPGALWWGRRGGRTHSRFRPSPRRRPTDARSRCSSPARYALALSCSSDEICRPEVDVDCNMLPRLASTPLSAELMATATGRGSRPYPAPHHLAAAGRGPRTPRRAVWPWRACPRYRRAVDQPFPTPQVTCWGIL